MEGAQKPRFPSRQFCSDRREATDGGSEVPTFSLLHQVAAELPRAHNCFFIFWPKARGKHGPAPR